MYITIYIIYVYIYVSCLIYNNNYLPEKYYIPEKRFSGVSLLCFRQQRSRAVSQFRCQRDDF